MKSPTEYVDVDENRDNHELLESQSSSLKLFPLDVGTIKRQGECLRVKLFMVLELVAFSVCISFLIYALYYNTCYNDYKCFRNFMVGSFVSGGFLVILVLIHKEKFQKLVDTLQNLEIGRVKLPNLIVSSFLVIGFIDFLLLSISAACPEGHDCDEPLLDPHGGNGEVRHITRTLTAVSAFLFAFTILSHWDHFSYLCAHQAWAHAFLYCTIVGGVILEVARRLVEPTELRTTDWSWHSKHETSKILDRVMLIVLGFVTMFV